MADADVFPPAGGYVSPAGLAADLAALRAPTRRSTNLLLVSTSDPESEDNAPAMIQTSDATTLTNRPAAWASGTVIAYRTVTSLRPHVLVTLVEAFPKRRVWQNFYNGGTKAWIGWELVAGPGKAEAAAGDEAGGDGPPAGE